LSVECTRAFHCFIGPSTVAFELQLNAVEEIDTLERVYDDFFMGLFGVISIILADTPFWRFAGMVYFLIAIPKTIVPWTMGIKRKQCEAKMLVA
jgi:hypothetical protein